LQRARWRHIFEAPILVPDQPFSGRPLASRPLRTRELLSELRRRHVFRVAVAYIVGAWVVLQVADVVVPALELPVELLGVLVWLAALGLPVAIALAWIYEWTGDGVRREGSGDDVAGPGTTVGSGPGASGSGAGEAGHGSRGSDGGGRVDGDVAGGGDRDGVRTTRHLIVLPFRVLRPDPETDFLAFALPDAITCNLAGLRSLIVRSSIAASRYHPATDLRVLAEEADVDVVLTGTLLRAGPDLEVRMQLADTRDGTLLWSQSSRAGVDDLFLLQEQVTSRIVESLSLPLSAREHRQLRRDTPASPHAYKLYLRANQLSVQVGQWSAALELYLACLAVDPGYAPAWARAARCQRLLAKYDADPAVADERAEGAEAAFRRALELNPDLPLAQSLYADLEVDTNRAEQAMVRLLGRLEVSGPHPEILAGLVQACRFCGLLEASVRADELARELDPQVRTSVSHTHFMAGDYEAALGSYNEADIGYMEGLALTALGRGREAVERLREREALTPRGSLVLLYITSLRACLDGERDESVAIIQRGMPLQRDGEGIYYVSRQLAFMGQAEDALRGLERSLEWGYFCYPAAARDPWLNGLRELDGFQNWLTRVRVRHEQAGAAFRAAGGLRLLAAASPSAAT
jgi:eukaryotic-like serine/threonine-protein kinase